MKPEVVAFLDTNYCLHYPMPASTDWLGVLDAAKVRLVFCLPMIDELDEKKSHEHLSGRASEWLKLCETCLNAPVAIRKDVTLEIYAPDNNAVTGDAEIAKHARSFIDANPNTPVVLVTEDTGMMVRCKSVGVPYIKPDKAARHATPMSEERKKIASQDKELRELRDKLPDVKLLVSSGREEDFSAKFIKVELHRPQWSFHSLLPRYLRIPRVAKYFRRNNGIEAIHMRGLEQWCDSQDTATDESARTVSLMLKLHNAGKAPANGVEVTIRYDPTLIMSEANRSQWSGSRHLPRLFHEFLPAEGGDINFGTGMYDEHPKLDIADTLPRDLAHMSREQIDRHAPEVKRGIVEWRLQSLGHSKMVDNVLYLTYANWDAVKPFQLQVRIYAIDPPIDQVYEIGIVPTVV